MIYISADDNADGIVPRRLPELNGRRLHDSCSPGDRQRAGFINRGVLHGLLTLRSLRDVGSAMRSHYGFGRRQIRSLSGCAFLYGGKIILNNIIFFIINSMQLFFHIFYCKKYILCMV